MHRDSKLMFRSNKRSALQHGSCLIQIIDGRNFSFKAGDRTVWNSTSKADATHWTRFAAYQDLLAADELAASMNAAPSAKIAGTLQAAPALFMRWKEIYFVSTQPGSGLTIDGFYYICLDKQSGALDGWYYDPNCGNEQRLVLSSDVGGIAGISAPVFDLL